MDMSEDRKECHKCLNFNKCNENVSYESNYCNVHRKQKCDKSVANIEADVKKVKRYLENSAYKESESDFFKNGGWEMVDLEIPQAMANILAERERDKKWIREKQEMDKKYVVQLTDEQYRKLVEVIEQKNRKHFEQKVRNKIEEIEKINFLYEKALGDIVTTDKENIQLKKQIRLMAEAFKQDDVRTVEEIIEYFKNKAKENEDDGL